MKTNIRKYTLTALTACALLAASCVKETSRFEGEEGGGGTRNSGYLSFSDLIVTVEDRTENVGQTPEAYAATRAGNTDLESYNVVIMDADGELVELLDKNGTPCTQFRYGDRPEQIELPVGLYMLSVFSGETPPTAWEGEEGTPTYGATQRFTIVKGETTLLQEMTCHLLSVKVSVAYKDTLIATMSENTQAELVLGDNNSLTFEGKEPALAGYLKPEADRKNPLVLYLTTTFNGKRIDRQPLTVTSDAKAGEWRKITVGLQNAEDGTLIINADIETWISNEEVVIDTRTIAAFCEERIPDENDPDAPKLLWPGHSFDEPFTLDADKFDDNGYFNEPCDFTISTAAPMVSFTVNVATDNAEFEQYLKINRLTEAVDLFTVQGIARTTLRAWGFPAVNLNVTERTFPLKDLMKLLFDYEGTHTFTMTIADEEGRKSTYALTIAVQLATGTAPRIVWEGKDIGQRYDAVEGLEVNIRITAPLGVRSLLVEISGALDLDGMLPASFDLADPETAMPGLSATLEGFGFPVGDEVEGQTSISFDISAFIPLMETFKGDTDFTLTVIDTEGETITEKVMIRVL
ncbi:MAG: DUF4493 domain-containing protein [Alistipes sp.]|nr:DUF4493 domain-containing protein [Alistipes senegalensis]MCM1250943.1 DUF4493 domain-containing protein [Alistipes sp.]